jgi:hypothetical protein
MSNYTVIQTTNVVHQNHPSLLCLAPEPMQLLCYSPSPCPSFDLLTLSLFNEFFIFGKKQIFHSVIEKIKVENLQNARSYLKLKRSVATSGDNVPIVTKLIP